MTTTDAGEAQSQPGMTKPEPQKEHQWLARLVGEWTLEGEASMGPANPTKFQGTERGRSLGGVWFIVDGEGAIPDLGSCRAPTARGRTS